MILNVAEMGESWDRNDGSTAAPAGEVLRPCHTLDDCAACEQAGGRLYSFGGVRDCSSLAPVGLGARRWILGVVTHPEP